MTKPIHHPLAFYCVAHGAPAPKGSKRHIGHGVMIEASKALEPWAEAVTQAALRAQRVQDAVFHGRHDLGGAPVTDVNDRPWSMLDGPLKVELVFTVRKPLSAPKRRQTWPVARPDVDKMARGVLDALQAAGVFRDDSQVVDLRAVKCYPGEAESRMPSPGCEIRMWRVNAEA